MEKSHHLFFHYHRSTVVSIYFFLALSSFLNSKGELPTIYSHLHLDAPKNLRVLIHLIICHIIPSAYLLLFLCSFSIQNITSHSTVKIRNLSLSFNFLHLIGYQACHLGKAYECFSSPRVPATCATTVLTWISLLLLLDYSPHPASTFPISRRFYLSKHGSDHGTLFFKSLSFFSLLLLQNQALISLRLISLFLSSTWDHLAHCPLWTGHVISHRSVPPLRKRSLLGLLFPGNKEMSNEFKNIHFPK